jgi:SET domain-containing protein
MIRYFDEDRFEIYALRDIQAGEELTHTYRSLKWRKVFVEQAKEGSLQ